MHIVINLVFNDDFYVMDTENPAPATPHHTMLRSHSEISPSISTSYSGMAEVIN
jgi:hypothetical protein